MVSKLKVFLIAAFFVVFSFLSFALPFPQRIDGLRLVRIVSGKEAMRMVNRLHGKKIPAVSAWVLEYGGSGFLRVWVSEARSESEAEKQFDIMMDKIIKNPRSPFSDFKEKLISGKRVFFFRGMGVYHSAFCSGRLVFWLEGKVPDFQSLPRVFLGR